MTGDDDATRRELFELLLAEEGLQSEVAAGIPRRPPDEDPPLSYAQERLWFLEQFEDDTSALGVRTAVRVHGPVDADLLERSVDAVVRRHEVLRTVFADVVGEPAPQVLDDVAAPLLVDDLRTSPNPDDDLARIMREEAGRIFDLEHEPPLMVRLVQLADDRAVLSVVMHHIASDGRSLQVFLRDLSACYIAFRDEQPVPLAELPISYLDYASWQRGWNSEAIDHQLEYWTGQLGDDVSNYELPTDHPRPPVHTVEGAQVSREIPSGLLTGLRELGRRNGATLFMTLLAAFKLVLDRRTGRPGPDDHDVTVGTPVAGRIRPELEDLVGVFLNTLVLRTDLGGDPTFAELLQRVRDVSLDAFANQDVPFERLLAELHPVRDLSRTPFFSVFFNMMSIELEDEDGAERLLGHDVEVLEQPDLGSKFDLTMYVNEHRRAGGDGLDMLLVYNRRLYDASTMADLFDQYLAVLEAVVADPGRRLSEYSLVTDAAHGVLPAIDESLDRTWHGAVPDLLDAQAARRPDHIAVTDRSVTWTYAELSADVHRLARWLRDRGIAKGDVVAIHGPRRAALVRAAVGALAAGAGYTILDPSYPPARLVTYLCTARPKAFVHLAGAGDVPADVGAALDQLGVEARLTLPAGGSDGTLPDDLDAVSSDPLGVELGPDDLACVTFTSGSTGEPKAVLGRHGSLTHFLPWQSAAFEVTEHDRFSMLSGLSHDPIQRDMFWPLSIGATIVVPDPDQIPTPGWLARWLRDEQITVVHLTPAMGRLVLEAPRSAPDADAPITDLRVALFIGEPLMQADVARLHARAPRLRVVNLYGTTETQRASGYHVVERRTADAAADADAADAAEGRAGPAIVPLGTGMPGAQLLVRSSGGGDAGRGEIGEIWLRSHHLALGYLGRPEETAERFRSTPGAGEPTDRMYRTGDLGRYLEDGVVEFVGRVDQQVQLRGFRIELEEIRAALRRHDAVADAVVVMTDDDHRPPELVAYVVPGGADVSGAGPTAAELAAFLRTSLPAHMVPARLVTIDAIPLTPNGKLDRRALPTPAVADVESSGGDTARDSLEQLLIELWKDVLGRSNIGIHDDFFDLGGYSLLATRLFALIEEATGQRVPVATLFQSPTIAELAETIRSSGWTSDWTSLVPIKPGGARRPLFYVTPYLISVLQLAHLGDELGDDQPLYGLQPQGLEGDLPAHETIEDMAAHYVAEVRTVQPHGPYALGGHCSGAWVAFEMARQLEAQGEEIDTLLLVDQGPPGVERPRIPAWKYVFHRTKFFLLDGRLHHAIAWQLKIHLNRHLLRRVGPQTVRYTEEVRAAHHLAHRAYQGGAVASDVVLLRSAETLALEDRVWFLHWRQLTTGDMHMDDVPGTHANLLERPYVVVLASKMRAALDRPPSRAATTDPTPGSIRRPNREPRRTDAQRVEASAP